MFSAVVPHINKDTESVNIHIKQGSWQIYKLVKMPLILL
jgi:hypothetical protein